MYSQAIETQAIGFYRKKKKHHYSPASNVPAGCIFLLFLKFGPIGFTDACMVDSATFLRFSHEKPSTLVCSQSERKKSLQMDKTFTRGWGVLPYINYIDVCRPIGLGFWAVLVWKRVYTLSILVWNRVLFSRDLRSV